MHKKKFKPETLMMSYGYKPELSEGAVKCPIFQTSTFAFKTAEEGKAFFEVAYGIREKNPEEEMGLIYSGILVGSLLMQRRISKDLKFSPTEAFAKSIVSIIHCPSRVLSTGLNAKHSQCMFCIQH